MGSSSAMEPAAEPQSKRPARSKWANAGATTESLIGVASASHPSPALTCPAPGFAVVYPIGMMLIGTAALAVPCYFAKQSQILCYIIVGFFVGSVPGSSGNSLKTEMHMSDETTAVLYDLGILFVLFMGGMEVDIPALKKAWKMVLINGMGQICLNLGSFCAICIAVSGSMFTGKFLSDDGYPDSEPRAPDGIAIFYFGICCTLSSTILVLGALKKRNEMAADHGQIILGLMVLQDVTAVLTIALLTKAFDPTAKCKKANNCDSIGVILGGLIMWMAILPVVLYLLNRYVLDRVFRFFAKTRELLFICTFAYSLGVAALFGWFLPEWIWGSFDQAIGIFFAGVSIAALPYRVQIETFVEPIKAFGVVLFFFILGVNLPIIDAAENAPQDLVNGVIMGTVIAVLTLVVFPLFILLTGLMSGLNGRTAFMIGFIVNQVSEFSLIIGSMAYGMGVFSQTMYLALVCVCVYVCVCVCVCVCMCVCDDDDDDGDDDDDDDVTMYLGLVVAR